MNSKTTIGFSQLMYGNLFCFKGDGPNAVEHLKKCIKYTEEAQIVLILGYAWAQLGRGYYFLDELII